MKRRSLEDLEARQVLDALLQSRIATESICREAVESCSLIPSRHRFPPLVRGLRPTIAYVALRSRASGITLGREIYVRHQLFDQQGRLPLYLVAHEVAHVAQFLRDGTLPFLSRYLYEYFLARLRGVGDRAAYLGISFEEEARFVETFLDAEDPFDLRP